MPRTHLGNISLSLIIILFLILNNSICINSLESGMKKIDKYSIIESLNAGKHGISNYILGSYNYDEDDDKISDLIELSNKEYFNVIITLKRINKDLITALSRRGINIQEVYNSAISAIYATNVSRNDIEVIRRLSLNNLIFIEPDFERSILMDRATRLIGIRQYLWPFIKDVNEYVTVAIIDTGIDANHADLKNRVIYWEDLAEGYTHPVDFNGHGTMVSSIIAGSGEGSVHGIVNITIYGRADVSSHKIFSLDVPFDQIVNFSINIRGNSHEPSIYDLLLVREKSNMTKELRFESNETKQIYLKHGYYRLYLSSNAITDYRLIVSVNRTTDNKPPMRGVNPTLYLAVFKIFKGNSSITYDHLILKALDRIYQLAKKLKIVAINLSLGGYVPSLSLDSAINRLAEKGVITVIAAGNSYLMLSSKNILERQIGSPATAAYAITVGGVNDYLGLALYSARGGSYTDGANLPYVKPDVVAPSGGLVYGSWIVAADTGTPDGSFSDISNDYRGAIGTSFSAPLVTGIIASLIAYLIQINKWHYNASSVLYLKSLLLASAVETHYFGLHETSYLFNGTTISRSPPAFNYGQKDYDEGFGLIHVPSLLFALTRNYSKFNELRIIINQENYSYYSLKSADIVSIAFQVTLNGCYRIRAILPRNYFVAVYKLCGWDGSPVYVGHIAANNNELVLRGRGLYCVSLKPITGGKINNTIIIEIKKTPCLNPYVTLYAMSLFIIMAIIILISKYRSRKRR